MSCGPSNFPLSVQSNLEYVATWNSAMLQSSVSLGFSMSYLMSWSDLPQDTPAALKGAMEKKPATFPDLGKPPTAKL